MKPTNRTALKEWAVTVKALEEGRQILLVRKGGIQEGSDGFEVEEPEFFLFPTFEHQEPESLQPAYRPWLEEAIATRPSDTRIRISSYATVERVIPAPDRARLESLLEECIWSLSFLRGRYGMMPGKPLYALLLRVYRLPQAHLIENRREYSGCRSWVTLAESLSTAGTKPILSEEEFFRRAEVIVRQLSTVTNQPHP